MKLWYNNKTSPSDLTYSKKVANYSKKHKDTLAHFRNYVYLCTRKNDKRSYICKRLNGEVAELVDALL